MPIWLIEPHDPLIVRDGRPFGPDPGARATSLLFPFPSTTTGGVRTRAGLNGDGIFAVSKDQIELLRKLKVRGPLLVQLPADGNDIESNKWLVPAPLDALLFEPKEQSANEDDEKNGLVRQLVPLQLIEGAETDFDSKNEEVPMLVGLTRHDPNKPIKEPPPYWYWNTFQDWLLDPSLYNGKIKPLSELGHIGPNREHRLHVSIDSNRRVARDGALFETSGLEFTHTSKKYEERLSEAQRLALAVIVDENEQFKLHEGLASLGGERRIISWRKSNGQIPLCSDELKKAIITQKACRVILLTPAYFEEGYQPNWVLESKDGVQPQLRATAIQRPQIVSGWDLLLREPKPTRRLAPAGTVLFLKLEGTPEAIGKWVDTVWMQCISDNDNDNDREQYRNDGFGLAVLGTWSGKPEVMQKGQQS